MKQHARHKSIIIIFLIVLVTFIIYFKTLGSYFTSESFIVIRIISENSFYQNTFGTWFNFHWVKFYRPVSGLLLLLIYKIFGVNHVIYHLIGLSFHILSAIQVILIANLLTNRKNVHIGHVAGLLFAIYPLQPTVVVYVATYSTVFCIFFILAALLAFLYFRESGLRRYYVLALIAFVMALGSYEMAFVCPALVIICDWLRNESQTEKRGIKELLPAQAGFFLILILYFLARKAIVGTFLAGFLGSEGIVTVIINYIRYYPFILLKLITPNFSDQLPDRILQFGLAAVILISVLITLPRLITKRENLSMGLFALLWISIASFMPGHIKFAYLGRHWYLASIGVSIGLSFLIVRSFSFFHFKNKAVLSAGVLVLVVVYYLALLTQFTTAYQKGGALTHTLQKQLMALDSETAGTDTFLVGNYPQYVKKNGAELTQILVFGLTDSVRPPFTNRKVSVYAIPAFSAIEDLPAIDPARKVQPLLWNDSQEKIEVISWPVPKITDPAHFPDIEVVYPPDNSVLDGFGDNFGFAFADGKNSRFRLVFLTPLTPVDWIVRREQTVESSEMRTKFQNSSILSSLPKGLPAEEILFFPLSIFIDPQKIEDIDNIYRDQFFWWVEALDDQEKAIARSKLVGFRIQK